MKLNCRPGDLAIVIRSRAGHEGKILLCIRLASDEEVVDYELISPYWLVDRALPSEDGDMRPIFPDINLRPLRDEDGTDEVLRKAGAPNKTD